MLKLTKRVEYSLIALSHMQNMMDSEKLSTSKEIAQKYSLPKEILAKSLQQLAKLGIIDAVKGSQGGYRVKDSLNDVNFMDFIESIEGPQGLVGCSMDLDCTIIDVCNIRQPINTINKNLKTMFSNISIGEITK